MALGLALLLAPSLAVTETSSQPMQPFSKTTGQWFQFQPPKFMLSEETCSVTESMAQAIIQARIALQASVLLSHCLVQDKALSLEQAYLAHPTERTYGYL